MILPIIAKVYQDFHWPFTGRYLVGVVVALPDERWEYRELKVKDRIPLAGQSELIPEELAHISPYLWHEGA